MSGQAKRICVFLGANTGVSPTYGEANFTAFEIQIVTQTFRQDRPS